MEMVVVSSPQSAEERDRLLAALQAVGLHPMSAVEEPKAGLFGDTPRTFPILTPKTESKQAEAIIRAVLGGVPEKDQYEAPVSTAEQAKRAFGAIGLLALIIVGLSAVLLLVQYLAGQLIHHG